MVAIHTRSGAGGRRVLLVALSFLALVPPATARAGTYTVTACDWSGRTDGWVDTATPGHGTSYVAGCPGMPSAVGGILARNVGRADTSRAPHGSHGSRTFWAPAGTRIVGLSGYYLGFGKYPWVPGIRDPDSGRWLNCSLACPIMFFDWSYLSYGGLSLRGVSITTVCWASGGCLRNADNNGKAQLSHASVVLADDSLPSVAITGGTLTAPGWLRGVQSLAYSASDNTGIRTLRTLVDGRSVARDERPCDGYAVIPCANASGPVNLNTAALGADGQHTLTLEATDGGYNLGSASRTVYIDNTPPGQPGGLAVTQAGSWRSNNRFAASWSLPPNQASPIAGISYELCPSPATAACTKGQRDGTGLTSISDLTVPGDGSWTLRVWLRDQAGNEDRDRAVTGGPLRLDRVAPTVALEPRDADDPTRVAVRASDAVSGVGALAVEVHRHGTAEWRQLAVNKTTDNRYEAVVDDEILAAGTYDIRARAVDEAGNEKTTSTWATGAAATIELPARLRTTLTAGRRVVRSKRPRLDRTVSADFGSAVVLHGRLTMPGGNPVASTDVEVWQRTPLPSGEFARIGTVHTGPRGGFRFRVPRGTSRIVRFRYPGTALQRGSTRDVVVAVRASTTMRVSRQLAANGDYVTFRGRLRGRPIPSGGKLVELQVYTRRRWRTFAQPRASAKTGRWSFPYRFEAVRGQTTFRFRARIREEALYPYELGTSHQVRVQVHGL